MTAPGSHYFDEEPTTESAPREVSLLLPDRKSVVNMSSTKRATLPLMSVTGAAFDFSTGSP